MDCLNGVKVRLAVNFLYLNDSETEPVLFEPNGKVMPSDINMASHPVSFSHAVTSLGLKCI